METPESATPASSPSWLRFIFGKKPAWTIVRILFVVFASIVLFKFVLIPIRVTGSSMEPTFKNGQIKFVNKLAYLRGSPARGDIIAAEFDGPQILLLKRIVGLPGESFRVISGEIYINGEKLPEPYADGKIPASNGKLGTSAPIPLGEDEYMVIGDNRKNSEGYIKRGSELLGKVL